MGQHADLIKGKAMDSCGSCCGSNVKFDGLSADYRRRLWIVIAINAAMFFMEMTAGVLSR